VTIADIRAKMIEYTKIQNKSDLQTQISAYKHCTASNGWVRLFMRRWNFTLRRISGRGTAFKDRTHSVIIKYLCQVSDTIEKHGFKDNEIINFDETSFYMDSVSKRSVATRGARRVYARTTGKEKVRLSCLMTSTASGHKFPILCVVPRKKKINALETNPNELLIIYET